MKKFPQANSIDRILYIVENFDAEDFENKEHFADRLNMVSRQVDYYIDALHFLDIIDEHSNYTEVGELLKSSSVDNKYLHMRNLIVNRPVFRELYREILSTNKKPSLERITTEIKKYYELNDTTSKRRASTVQKWLDWLAKNKYVVTKNIY